MANLVESNYYDTSLRDIPGPNRTFAGPTNTGEIPPPAFGKIKVMQNSDPVGLEHLFANKINQKAGYYAAGGALYAFSALEGLSSLYYSGQQFSDILLEGKGDSVTTFGTHQVLAVFFMLMLEWCGTEAIRRARSIRSRI